MVKRSKQKKETLTKKIRENPWILSTFVLGALCLILITGILSSGTSGVNTIPSDAAAKKLVEFLNRNAPSEVTLESVSSESGLYKVNVKFRGNTIPVYMTQDGTYFIQSVIPISDSSGESRTTDSSQETEIRRVEVSVDDDPVKGSEDAPVTIIEFSDFQCPFCARFYSQTLPQIEETYIKTGKVKLVYRDFPLDFHENAQKAAEAAECADEQSKFWEYHDKLFQNQNALDTDSLKKYAKEIGLDTEQFNNCLDSGKMESEVKKDFADGQAAGVRGTPAFFINGRPLSGAQPFSEFQKIIEEELANI